MDLETKKQKARDARKKSYQRQKAKFKKLQAKKKEEAKMRREEAIKAKDQELWGMLQLASTLYPLDEHFDNTND